jgi:RNA polymerase sigma factor (sigma-70 family)
MRIARGVRDNFACEDEPTAPMTPKTSPQSISAKLEQARRFDLFVRRFRRPLLQYFRRRGIEQADADDLVQIVFLKLLRKMQCDIDSLSDGYVFTAASSVLIDHRRRRATTVFGAAVEIDEQLAGSEPDGHQILEDRQTLRVILDVLFEMSSKWRRAFVLHRFDQLSYAEIAKRMGVSASSVEKYVMAALAELRDSTDRDRHD